MIVDNTIVRAEQQEVKWPIWPFCLTEFVSISLYEWFQFKKYHKWNKKEVDHISKSKSIGCFPWKEWKKSARLFSCISYPSQSVTSQNFYFRLQTKFTNMKLYLLILSVLWPWCRVTHKIKILSLFYNHLWNVRLLLLLWAVMLCLITTEDYLEHFYYICRSQNHKFYQLNLVSFSPRNV